MAASNASISHGRSIAAKFLPRPGDWVEIRSHEEILATLDEKGTCDGVPFMPEMLRYCGQRFEVFRRAEKTCSAGSPTLRRVRNTVHLKELRCDGSAHGNCEAGCLIFWKEQWLKPSDRGASNVLPSPGPDAHGFARRESALNDLLNSAAVALRAPNGDGQETYFCQATEICRFSSLLPWWYLGQYIRDLTSGNVRLSEMAKGIFAGAVSKFRGVAKFKREHPAGQNVRTASANTKLDVGELVQVKTAAEIAATLDQGMKHRGLRFTPGMRRYCGGEFRVIRRVTRVVDESTGKMIFLKNDCYVLDGAICPLAASRFCSRMAYQYWRDVWLTRVSRV